MEKGIFYRNAFDLEMKRISMLDSTISIPFCSPPCQGIEGTRLHFLSEISPIFTRPRLEIRMGFTIITLKEILLRSDTFEELMSLSSRYKSGKWSCLFWDWKFFIPSDERLEYSLVSPVLWNLKGCLVDESFSLVGM